MKKILIILLFTLSSYSGDTYCDFYFSGYVNGYCDDYDDCIEPILPLCPTPEVNRDTDIHAYNRGFKEGYNANH